MAGPALSIVPYVWQALGFTTGMGILYDMEGPKVTLEAQERDANTREALRNAAIKQYETAIAKDPQRSTEILLLLHQVQRRQRLQSNK